eukprot:5778806-Pleurochrysis_carterae.AAC.1
MVRTSTTLPPAGQAQLVATFLSQTSIPRRLDYFPAADMCLGEITRRATTDASHAYTTLFRNAW